MSYSFSIVDGDLHQLGSQLGIVYGINKLNQDIELWLKERYGGDRFHVTMGSVLQEFIGSIVGGGTRVEVQNEVLRVLQNYQAVQFRRIKEKPETLSTSELLVSIDDIKTTISYDTVSVAVHLRNGSNTASTIHIASGV